MKDQIPITSSKPLNKKDDIQEQEHNLESKEEKFDISKNGEENVKKKVPNFKREREKTSKHK